MLTVSPLCSPEQRQELAKLMFDVFAVPALCMANQAVLSLYSTGRTTGLVCELGEGMTYVVPIYEGFALKHAVLSLPIAGMDLTKYLSKLLSGEGAASSSGTNNRASLGGSGGSLGGSGGGSSVWSFALESPGGGGSGAGGSDIVRDIKEKLCRVKPSKWDYNVVAIQNSNAATAVAQASAAASVATASPVDTDETSYELPDGTMIRLDDHARFNSLEILFAPEKYAAALGVHLTGGANQSFGVSAAQTGSNSGGGLGSSSSGGSSAAAAAALAASDLNRASSSASSGGPPTPSSAPLGGGGNNPPGSAGSNASHFSSHFAGGHSARDGGSGASHSHPRSSGPISIDLSTNDLIGVHQMVYQSLGMCDSFLRRELLKNIVLAGGTSMAKGFGERMKREVGAMVAQENAALAAGGAAVPPAAATAGTEDAAATDSASAASPLNIITDSQRKYAAWIGASMYASLPTFNIIKITAEQYKRDENVVHKKFF